VFNGLKTVGSGGLLERSDKFSGIGRSQLLHGNAVFLLSSLLQILNGDASSSGKVEER
jgi:hypothetical protein